MVRTPKRHIIPLILLLSVFALFFYSHFSTTSTAISNLRNPSFPLGSSPQTPNFTFIIKVLAYNRLDSLSRCLRSLAAADYLSDTVHLHIYIDHFSLADNSSSPDHNLETWSRILEFADNFKWKFGDKLVHYRSDNVGLQAQWLEAWWPSSDDEFAFVVEDDLEVSPIFYKFVRAVILKYYYDESNFSPSVFGVTLQRARFVPGKHGNKIQVDDRTRVFLYQLVGTWGQILFPKPWKEFRKWYDDHKAKGIKPIIGGMVTTGWYKRLGDKIWTPWFIKFIHSRGYFNIYTNFLHDRALSVSHRDAGVNYGKTAGPDSQLIDEKYLDFDYSELQPLSNLKWYDFCFREVIPGRVVGSYHELGSVLHSVQRNKSVTLVSNFGVSEIVVKNLLCHFEKVNIRNYILVGAKSDFLLDLARRGNPVIDADRFLKDVGAQYSRPSRDILVKAYVIKKCLELGYNALAVNGNVAFDGDSMVHAFNDPAFDMVVVKGPGVVFVRSQKQLSDMVVQETHAVLKSSSGKDASDSNGSRVLEMAGKALERKGVRVKWIEEGSLFSNIDSDNGGEEKKAIWWPANTGNDLVKERLEKHQMWFQDSDSYCSAVVCHQL